MRLVVPRTNPAVHIGPREVTMEQDQPSQAMNSATYCSRSPPPRGRRAPRPRSAGCARRAARARRRTAARRARRAGRREPRVERRSRSPSDANSVWWSSSTFVTTAISAGEPEHSAVRLVALDDELARRRNRRSSRAAAPARRSATPGRDPVSRRTNAIIAAVVPLPCVPGDDDRRRGRRRARAGTPRGAGPAPYGYADETTASHPSGHDRLRRDLDCDVRRAARGTACVRGPSRRPPPPTPARAARTRSAPRRRSRRTRAGGRSSPSPARSARRRSPRRRPASRRASIASPIRCEPRRRRRAASGRARARRRARARAP